jgi:hypothetical protein
MLVFLVVTPIVNPADEGVPGVSTTDGASNWRLSFPQSAKWNRADYTAEGCEPGARQRCQDAMETVVSGQWGAQG